MLPCLKANISKIGKQEQQETSPTGVSQSLNLKIPAPMSHVPTLSLSICLTPRPGAGIKEAQLTQAVVLVIPVFPIPAYDPGIQNDISLD